MGRKLSGYLSRQLPLLPPAHRSRPASPAGRLFYSRQTERQTDMSKFTVTHVHSGGLVTDLYQCDKVSFISRAGVLNPCMGALELRDHDDVFVAGLWDGTAYVSNDGGKTVARYDLPPSPTSSPRVLEPVNGIFQGLGDATCAAG
jgi:hypothetical protein